MGLRKKEKKKIEPNIELKTKKTVNYKNKIKLKSFSSVSVSIVRKSNQLNIFIYDEYLVFKFRVNH